MQTIDSELEVRIHPQTRSWVADYWPVSLLAFVTLALYTPVLGRLVRQWYDDPNYSHGFFVPAFSGYLIWNKRRQIGAIKAIPSVWGAILVLGPLAVLYLGSLGSELFLQRISLVGVIAGLIVYFTGWRRLRAVAFPMVFLFFMIPLPAMIYNQIVFPLQLLASRFATSCLETLNLFPVLREGNLLILDGYTLEVVDACSGIRSLTSLVALAMGYSYLAERRLGIRIFLVLAMVPVAIVSNGIRVVITGLLVNYFGISAAEGFIHSFSGWAIFLISVMLLLALHRLINTIPRRTTAATP
ncbi:MAG: exosortase/archaeosortase family protein [Candidatus Sulfotelmatobacter sp.]